MEQCTEDLDPRIFVKDPSDYTEELARLLDRFSSPMFETESPIYAIPHELLQLLQSEVPSCLREEEFVLEEELAEFCQRHDCIGVETGRLLSWGWLTNPSRGRNESAGIGVTQADMKLLGWDRDWTLQQANHLLNVGGERTDAIRQPLQAFLGWLVTNPEFVAEVEDLKQKEQMHIAQGEAPDDALLCEYLAFCRAWHLDGMATWNLPIPQEVNLTGEVIRSQLSEEAIHLTLPPTLKLPARFPLSQIMQELRNQILPDRLAEWRDVMNQTAVSKSGMLSYRQMLLLHFYRNIAFTSRYGDRVAGNLHRLDIAFGRFLGVRDESVKRLRLKIKQRLGWC